MLEEDACHGGNAVRHAQCAGARGSKEQQASLVSSPFVFLLVGPCGGRSTIALGRRRCRGARSSSPSRGTTRVCCFRCSSSSKTAHIRSLELFEQEHEVTTRQRRPRLLQQTPDQGIHSQTADRAASGKLRNLNRSIFVQGIMRACTVQHRSLQQQRR
jgi:hypothetical protein